MGYLVHNGQYLLGSSGEYLTFPTAIPPLGGFGIVNLQQVDISILGGFDSSTTSLSGFTNLDKTVVFESHAYSCETGEIPIFSKDIDITAYASDINTLTVERDGTIGELLIVAQVVEFNDATTVYKGTFQLNADDTLVVVDLPSNVNVNNAFMWATNRADTPDDQSAGDSDPNRRLVNHKFGVSSGDASNMIFERYAQDGSINGNWFVVEHSSLDVSHGSFFTSSQAYNLPTDIDMDHTFVLASQRSAEAQYNGEALRWFEVSEASINVRAYYGGDTGSTYNYQIVNCPDVSTVWSNFIGFDHDTSVSISPVGTTRSMPIVIGQNNCTLNSNYSNGNFRERSIRHKLLDSTNIGSYVSVYSSTTRQGRVIIEWPQITN